MLSRLLRLYIPVVVHVCITSVKLSQGRQVSASHVSRRTLRELVVTKSCFTLVMLQDHDCIHASPFQSMDGSGSG